MDYLLIGTLLMCNLSISTKHILGTDVNASGSDSDDADADADAVMSDGISLGLPTMRCFRLQRPLYLSLSLIDIIF